MAKTPLRTTNNFIQLMDINTAKQIKKDWFDDDMNMTFSGLAEKYTDNKNAKAGIKILNQAANLLNEYWG